MQVEAESIICPDFETTAAREERPADEGQAKRTTGLQWEG
jgi:hypothetical protein